MVFLNISFINKKGIIKWGSVLIWFLVVNNLLVMVIYFLLCRNYIDEKYRG